MDGILNPSTYSPGILDQSQMNPVMQQGNNQARGQALNSGLMAAGAGLLGANNLSEGLSAGLSGFNRAYDTSLVANRPKVTPLADGAFSQISFPDGTVQIVANPDVEAAILKRDKLKGDVSLNKAIEVAKIVDANKTGQADLKSNIATAGPGAITEFNPAITSSVEKLDKVANWISSGTADKVLGMTLPPASEAIDRTWGAMIGTDSYTNRRDLDEFIGKSVLDQAQAMKGALSDNDVKFLQNMNVKSSDPPDKKLDYLREFKARIIAEEKRRIEAAKNVQAKTQEAASKTGSGSGAKTATPSTSIQTYNSPMDVQAAITAGTLKSGSTFKDPNGVLRTVP